MSFLNLEEKASKFFKQYNGKEIEKELIQVDSTKKKIIGFIGLGGGVGTSSLIRQISLNMSYKILIIDADFFTPYHYIYSNRPESSFINYLLNRLNGNQGEIEKCISTDERIDYLYLPQMSLSDYLSISQEKKVFDIVSILIHEFKQSYDFIFIDYKLSSLDSYLGQALLKSFEGLVFVKSDSVSCELNESQINSLINLTSIGRITLMNKSTKGLPYETNYQTSELYKENYVKIDKSSPVFKEKFNEFLDIFIKQTRG